MCNVITRWTFNFSGAHLTTIQTVTHTNCCATISQDISFCHTTTIRALRRNCRFESFLQGLFTFTCFRQ